jgi:TM2 domain-containing membrane protein YozV
MLQYNKIIGRFNIKNKALFLYFTTFCKSIYSIIIIAMSYWDWVKNIGNNLVQEVGKKFSPPPEKDVFLING